MSDKFKNLIDVSRYFSSEEVCRKHLEQLRWGGTPVCPFCGSVKVYRFSDQRRFKCGEKECNKKFTVTVGTVLENTKVPLQKWFVAIYVITSHKKGISSLQLSKDIGVTQKTAWFLNHRIREMFKEKAPQVFDTTCEVDETWIGGKIANRHTIFRKKYSYNNDNKTAVFAIANRKGKRIFTKVVNAATHEEILPALHENIKPGTTIMSDEAAIYKGLKKKYDHHLVNHSQQEYVRGEYHTNTIEGFFSLLKRGIIGIYHQVSPKHLHRYCDEFAWRYGNRDAGEADRFEYSLVNCEGRLTYKQLKESIPPRRPDTGEPYFDGVLRM